MNSNEQHRKHDHEVLSTAHELVGQDGNAFMIIGRVTRALRQAGVPKEGIDAFTNEATSGDYNHVLQTAIATVTVT